LIKQVDAFDAFIEGGKSGLTLTIQMVPYLLAMFVAITVLRSSGILDFVIGLIYPLLTLLHIPAEIVPLAMIRPISGTAPLAIMTDLIKKHGHDSVIGLIASTVQCSTDSTFYVLSLYFGAVGITRIKYALKVGLLADLVGILTAIFIVKWVFG